MKKKKAGNPAPAPAIAALHEGTASMRRLALGAHLRQRRKQMKLTLDQLSQRSGLSTPFLSQLERNLATPSLVSLLALTRALQLDVQTLLQVPGERHMVCRAGQRPQIRTDSPARYFDLSSALPMRQLDALMMEIPAGHVYPLDQRNGEEFLYVLEGELYVEVGEVRTTLKAGDSLHFNSQLPHRSENRSERTVRLLYVGTPSVLRDARGELPGTPA